MTDRMYPPESRGQGGISRDAALAEAYELGLKYKGR